MSDELNDDFTSEEETDIKQQLAEQILSPNKNLELNTEISNTVQWSIYSAVEVELEERGLKQSASLLKKFRTKFYQLKVSKGRGGRKEFLEGFKSITNSLHEEIPVGNGLMD